MSFVAIIKTLENRVVKDMDFVTLAEADAHVAAFLPQYPDAFTAPRPTEPVKDWFIDVVAKTITIVPLPPKDYTAIDQATVERWLANPGIMRAFGWMMFEVAKAGRTGDWTFFDGITDAATFKAKLKGLIR